jgi:hypothetical protein
VDASEYLVSFGVAGEFGRFVPVQPVTCRRGDRVLVRTRRGVEPGTVLCQATAGHAALLDGEVAGPLLRVLTDEDESHLLDLEANAQLAFEAARLLTRELSLPLEILDVEAILDPRLLVVHYVGRSTDFRPLVSTLSKRFDALVEMFDLTTLPLADGFEAVDHHDGAACPDCGSTTGCDSCGPGGCGSCGHGELHEDLVQVQWKSATRVG